jgi:hypothetical protein
MKMIRNFRIPYPLSSRNHTLFIKSYMRSFTTEEDNRAIPSRAWRTFHSLRFSTAMVATQLFGDITAVVSSVLITENKNHSTPKEK